jgi:hypothetical protein
MSTKFRQPPTTALMTTLSRWSMALMLILISNLNYAKTFERAEPAEASETEIRAALCDLERAPAASNERLMLTRSSDVLNDTTAC